jgi:hypothetical protein|tara:strand:+ start:1026 stop:1253 length:228 start_codon:yes stop_codon:yes gene_type:complete
MRVNSEDITVYYRVHNGIKTAYCFWNGNKIEVPRESRSLPVLRIALAEIINDTEQDWERIHIISSNIPNKTSEEI